MSPADFTVYCKFFMSLFALINPIGILPVFLGMTRDQTRAASTRINTAASVTVAIILWMSFLFGDAILLAFGISVDSFRIAGGILLSFIAMSMVIGKLEEHVPRKVQGDDAQSGGNVGVVPLALPLMAGPGAISSTIMWGVRYTDWQSRVGVSVTVAIFALCCWLLYQSAPYLVRALGRTGINIVTKIMGILLMALAVEFVVTGLRNLFPILVS
jgi:MarC family membrane protein